MPALRVQQEEGWDHLHRSDARYEAGNGEVDYTDEEAEEDSQQGSDDEFTQAPALRTVGDVQRALHPLQATADRLGKQVEQFAETLDRLGIKKHYRTQNDYQYVLPLVQRYKTVAHSTVDSLKKIHGPELEEELKKSWVRKMRDTDGASGPSNSGGHDGHDAGLRSSVDDLQRWKAEEQTWELFEVMLRVRHPALTSQTPSVDQDRPSKASLVHRYSTEQDAWAHFLAEDDGAWERHNVVEWLKRSAETSGQDIDTIVAQLEPSAERGSGLRTDGWLDSKLAIKQQKRLRSWPQELAPDSPGLDKSLVNSKKTKPLVTQLDPDAITRQGRDLEDADLYFERAIWLTCWEMIRRGKSWDSIREWCQQRAEDWRATIVRGDPRGSVIQSRSPGEQIHSDAGWHSRILWRRMCAVAAREGGINEYEKAVYGVLSGDLASMEKACRGWDDYLFAHYNSYLLHQFDHYLQLKFPERLPSTPLRSQLVSKPAMDGGRSFPSGSEIIERMKRLGTTSERQVKQPLKALQESLIAKTFSDFVFKQGLALSKSANSSKTSKTIPKMDTTPIEHSSTALIRMQDYDLLRMITHMLFIYQDLGLDVGVGTHQWAVENIVVAYMEYLSEAGKQQLLPLYASRLSTQRSIMCLARLLPFITDDKERKTVMQLMGNYKIDIPGVLNMQLRLIISDTPINGKNSTRYPSLKIIDSTGVDHVGGAHLVRSDFIGTDIMDDERDLINGFSWYMLLDGYWKQTMAVGATLYKHLLRLGRLAAARQLHKEVPFPQLSLRKTRPILGRSVDISVELEDSDEEADGQISMGRSTRSHRIQSRSKRRSSSARRARHDQELLVKESSVFRDFEALIKTLDVMENWRRLVDKQPDESNPRRFRAWKQVLRGAHDRVVEAVQPLLHGWLQDPRDDEEAAEFELIRTACLPELVLAYNSILHYNGHVLSRDSFLKCMDLAALVAAEDGDLEAPFVAAGRVSELVDMFAIVSKSILAAEEKRAPGGKNMRKMDGASTDMWNVKVPSSG